MPEGFADDVESSFYAAISGETLVGFGQVDLKSGTVGAVFVRPDHFRTGIGKGILMFLETLATQSGITKLELEATLNAAAFYRAQGFTGDDVRSYKSPRGVTLSCVPMTKNLA